MHKNTSNALFEELVETYKKYSQNNLEGVNLINKAYSLAQVAYFNEKRLSGISFLDHSLNTALLCAYNQLDATTIASAILHDSFGFGVTKEDVEKEIDVEVAQMLESLEKIKTIRNRYSKNPNLNPPA